MKSQNKPSLALLGVMHPKGMHLFILFSSLICSSKIHCLRCFVVAEESACKWFLQFHNERPGPKPVFSMETMLFLHMSNQFDLGCLVLWWIELGNLHAIERKELNKDNPCTNCSLKLGRFIHTCFCTHPFFWKQNDGFLCLFFFAGKLGSIEICQDQI